MAECYGSMLRESAERDIDRAARLEAVCDEIQDGMRKEVRAAWLNPDAIITTAQRTYTGAMREAGDDIRMVVSCAIDSDKVFAALMSAINSPELEQFRKAVEEWHIEEQLERVLIVRGVPSYFAEGYAA